VLRLTFAEPDLDFDDLFVWEDLLLLLLLLLSDLEVSSFLSDL
jgi:hypothetical protein